MTAHLLLSSPLPSSGSSASAKSTAAYRRRHVDPHRRRERKLQRLGALEPDSLAATIRTAAGAASGFAAVGEDFWSAVQESAVFFLSDTRGMDSVPGCSEDGDGSELAVQKQEWAKTQDMLKSKLILEDDFEWSLPSMGSNLDMSDIRGKLKYIGGVDISFLKEDPSTACAAVVVLDACTLEVVHEEFDVVRMQVPYIPGFLAFREAPILLGLLEKMKANTPHFYPQLLMVDGNGLLHPRGFGLACHLGVLADLPTIGVGKNLHHVDGLNQSEVRRQLEAKENCNKELLSLTGQSGRTWGAAMRPCPRSLKPIYISAGHRISLDSAIGVVKFCCKYRVPEPVRQADIRSKVFLQKHQRLQQ